MDINLMISIFPSLLNGAVITLKLLASSMFFGLLIGLLFAILRINKNPLINKFEQFYKIILPQMLRLAIPNLSNVWQITLKDTSLISVTGLVEIMRQSYIAAGSTRDPLFFYSWAAVLYLMLTYLSMKIINKLEVRYNKGF